MSQQESPHNEENQQDIAVYGNYEVMSSLEPPKSIYIVKDIRDHQKKVLKIVPNANNDKVLKEIFIMQYLQACPYTLSVFDSFQIGNSIGIVTPYMSGGSMYDILAYYPNGINENAVRSVIRQVLLALQYMSNMGYCHRDIKPENIFVQEWNEINPKVVLADFGFATEFSDAQLLDDWVGTLNYCAPEIYFRQPYNNSVDIWSLGITMYCMLFGNFPLPDIDTQKASLQSALARKRIPTYRFNIKRMTDAKDLFEKMCKFDHNQRISIDKALQHPWINSGAKSDNNPMVSEITSALEAESDYNSFT